MFTNQEQNSSSALSGPTDLSLPSTVPGQNKLRDALLPKPLLQSLTTLQSFFFSGNLGNKSSSSPPSPEPGNTIFLSVTLYY